MIYGRLIDGKAIVPVIFRLPTQPDSLLGTALMEGYHLEIDFEDNGLVSLEKIIPSIS